MMISPEVIKEKVQSIVQLPALPAVAARVIRMVDNPKASTSALARLVAADQGLTAKILKIANSPFYGFPKKISTVDFAIIVLGYDALKEIIVSTSLVSSLEEAPDGYFDSRAFWDHSVASGVLARRLARDLGYRISGEAFVGGLLHDMGVTILNRHFKDEYRRIVGIVRETDLTFLEAEESVLGTTHAEVGGWLAERWNLPDQLVEAVSLHHTPAKAVRNPELVSLVHCADGIVCRIPGMKVEFDKGVEFDREALNRVQLNDTARINDYSCASLLESELAQLTESNTESTEGTGNHEG